MTPTDTESSTEADAPHPTPRGVTSRGAFDARTGSHGEPAPNDEQAPHGPLRGVRVVEFAGIGPAPFATMLLADLGAEVVRIDRAGRDGRPVVDPADTVLRGRAIVAADLKDPAAVERVRDLVDRADVLVEGFRPGVMERLGLGPDELLARNPRLVYGRMTGWGQHGPWAGRVGHDVNYLSITGMLHAIGPAERPAVPLNLVADYGGGAMFLVTGVLAALLERSVSGRGQVVDAAMVDGVGQLGHVFRSMLAAGRWTDERASNLIDGGAPYYAVYECADGGHVAVGALEPAFYAALLGGLGDDLDPAAAALDRDDPGAWPALRAGLEAAFARRDRDEWAAHFDGTDACVTPVLSIVEAAGHPHLVARGALGEWGGRTAPAPAPRFSRTPAADPVFPPAVDEELDAAIGAWGGAGRTPLRAEPSATPAAGPPAGADASTPDGRTDR